MHSLVLIGAINKENDHLLDYRTLFKKKKCLTFESSIVTQLFLNTRYLCKHTKIQDYKLLRIFYE